MYVNCTQLDEDAFATFEVASLYVIPALALAGTAMLLCGERLVKPAGTLIAVVLTAVGVYAAVASLLSCEMRLVTAALAAVLSGTFVLCIASTGIFLLGASGTAFVTHVLYKAVSPSDDKTHYVITLSVAAVTGAVVTIFQKRFLLRAISSLFGGVLLVASLHLLLSRTRNAPPSVLGTLLITASAAVGGTLFQTRMATRMTTRMVVSHQNDDVSTNDE